MNKETLELILDLKEKEVKGRIKECFDLSYDGSFLLIKDEVKLAELLGIKLNKKQKKENK